jgi:hypothetical protein
MQAYRKLVKATRADDRASSSKFCRCLTSSTGQQRSQKTELKSWSTFIPRARASGLSGRCGECSRAKKCLPVRRSSACLSRIRTSSAGTKPGNPLNMVTRSGWMKSMAGSSLAGKCLAGNPNDEQQWLPSLEHHIECFGRPPNQMSADRGVHSPQNEQIAQQRGVKRVILPQPGRERAKPANDMKSSAGFSRVAGGMPVLKAAA